METTDYNDPNYKCWIFMDKTAELILQSETGLILSIPYLASRHCDERPKIAQINMIVIHNISLPPGEFGSRYVSDFFCGKLQTSDHPYFAEIAELRVAPHFLIQRTGELTQFVPVLKRAWHAGVSYFRGESNCNDFSIGIELEGSDHCEFTEIQYQQLAKLITLLMTAYPEIKSDRIVGHEHIAPDRKTDPGPFFKWEYLKGMIE